eukprot:CAMPEP_0168596152 /NCGR_PEP_ID=MMETSP0420-20121227/9867_1 /TAXON_ID=498008 /ORGANISM="Pessonella sp." /LENGTH=267 /DNA_ID=CAMNT_0008632695 /DNA_START=422 /DNA_END=1225 /DNA_ORIENTATION=+
MALASFRKGRIAEEKLAFKFNNNSNADGDSSLSSSSSESSSSSSSSSRSLSASSTTSSSSNVDNLPVGSVLNMQRVVKPTDIDDDIDDDDDDDVKVNVIEKKGKRNSRDNEREIAKPKQLWDKKQAKIKKNNSKFNNDNKNNNKTNNNNNNNKNTKNDNDNDNNDKNKKNNEQNNSKSTEKIDDSDDQSSESSIFVFPANAKTFSISKVETSTAQQAIPLKAQSIVIESVVLPSKKAQKAAVINVEEEKEKSKQYKDKSLDGLMDLI